MATVKVGDKTFEVPQFQAYCEKCGTTNFIYDDMKPPYNCDDCGIELSESDFENVVLEQANNGSYGAFI